MKFVVLVVFSCLVTACSSNDAQFSTPRPERASEINLELGIDYFRRGDLKEAKDKFDRALEQNPRNAMAHTMSGLLYDRLDDDSKARSHYERAVSLDPKNPEILNYYAVFLCQHDRFAPGEKHALDAAKNQLYKTPEIAFLTAGNCARSAGDLARAEEHYRRALATKPRFGAALFEMADIEFRQNNYLSARAFLDRYVEVGRVSPATLWLGVRIERNLGNGAAAKDYAQRLKRDFPTATETKQLLESERNAG